MPNKIVHKKSGTTGLAPAPGELDHAELAINYADSDLYLKNLAGDAVIKVTHASNIKNTPYGNIAATTVQGAINELDSEKQAVLVSGTNIKTINSTSLLGSGDIVISGGSTDYGAVGTYVIAFVTSGSVSVGNTTAGSNLKKSTHANNVMNSTYSGYAVVGALASGDVTSIGLSGTWRLMTTASTALNCSLGLFLRVA